MNIIVKVEYSSRERSGLGATMAHQLKVERSKPCRLTPLLLEPGPSACEVRVRPLRYEPRQTCNNALRDTYFKGACLVKGAYLVKGGLAERILSCRCLRSLSPIKRSCGQLFPLGCFSLGIVGLGLRGDLVEITGGSFHYLFRFTSHSCQ